MDQVKNWIIGGDETKPIRVVGTKEDVKKLLVKIAQETFKNGYVESSHTETTDEVKELEDRTLEAWADNGYSYEDWDMVWIRAYPEEIIETITLNDEIIDSYPNFLHK